MKNSCAKKSGYVKKTPEQKHATRVIKMAKEFQYIQTKKNQNFLKIGTNKKIEEYFFFLPNINIIKAFNEFVETVPLLTNEIQILKDFTKNNTICNEQRCKLCSQYCYCEKARFQQNNMSSRFNVLLAYLTNKDKMKMSINNQIKQEDISLNRLHTEGDFFNEEYLFWWLDIMKTNKQTKFYTYTKQFELFANVKKLPKNFTLQLSYDTSCTYAVDHDLLKKGNVNIYLTYSDESEIIPFIEKNNLQGMKVANCMGKCKNCRNCYTNKGYIHLCKKH